MRSRRRFLRECSAAVISAALVPCPAVTPQGLMCRTAPEQLDFRQFAELVQTEFIVNPLTGAPVALQLVQAALSPSRPNETGEAFSLLFRGPNSGLAGQDTYRFEHPGLGRFEMFIVPVVATESDHTYYEANFNRRYPRSAATAPSNVAQATNTGPFHG